MKILSIIFSVFLFLAVAAHAQILFSDWERVAASQTNQVLGPVGGAGDVLDTLIIVPETVSAGTVLLSDGLVSGTSVFVAGTLSDLSPIVLKIGARSVSGSWQITTGANVHVMAIGRFK